MPEPQAVPLIRRSKLGEILSASRPASRDPLGGHLHEPPEAARGQVAVHVITEPRARIEPVGVKDDVLYLHTDQDAPRGKVVSADLAGMETGGTGNWAELIPERDDVLQRVERGGHGFLAFYLRDAQHRVVRFDAAGAELGELDLAGAGQHSDGSVSEVNVGEDSEECFLGVQSFVRGTRAYRVDLSTGRADPLVLTDRTAPVPDVVTGRRARAAYPALRLWRVVLGDHAGVQGGMAGLAGRGRRAGSGESAWRRGVWQAVARGGHAGAQAERLR